MLSARFPQATFIMETGTHSPLVSQFLLAERHRVVVANAHKHPTRTPSVAAWPAAGLPPHRCACASDRGWPRPLRRGCESRSVLLPGAGARAAPRRVCRSSGELPFAEESWTGPPQCRGGGGAGTTDRAQSRPDRPRTPSASARPRPPQLGDQSFHHVQVVGDRPVGADLPVPAAVGHGDDNGIFVDIQTEVFICRHVLVSFSLLGLLFALQPPRGGSAPHRVTRVPETSTPLFRIVGRSRSYSVWAE